MEVTLIALVVLSALFGLAVAGLQRLLPGVPDRLIRPVGILMGGLAGVALAIPVAIALNPMVGLQVGTFHNLMILAMCLSFLGLIIGSLAGLMYGGMILTTTSRTTPDDAPPLPSERGAVDSTVAPRHDPPEKPRSGREDDAATPSFGMFLAQAERPRDFKEPGGEG